MYSLQSIGVKAASLVIGRANLAIQFFYRPATIDGFDLIKNARFSGSSIAEIAIKWVEESRVNNLSAGTVMACFLIDSESSTNSAVGNRRIESLDSAVSERRISVSLATNAKTGAAS